MTQQREKVQVIRFKSEQYAYDYLDSSCIFLKQAKQISQPQYAKDTELNYDWVVKITYIVED